LGFELQIDPIVSQEMGRFISLYPGGSAGLALIILRWSLTAELCFLAYILHFSITDWEALVAADLTDILYQRG
jgi:hypothetical protein